MILQVSPRAIAEDIFMQSASKVALLAEINPSRYLLPTSMHPRVSSGVLPAWIRIPENHGTSRSSGRYRLNFGDLVQNTGYSPAGMAVRPTILSLISRMGRQVSSKVSQK